MFSEGNRIPLVNFTDLPYTPWSDNHYYPAFGVPSPLLMSWPDLYFHTDYLTADNLDPMVFRRCGITTALAALELANAGPSEAQSIMREVGNRSQFRLGRIALEAKAGAEEVRVRKRLTILARRDQQAVSPRWFWWMPRSGCDTRSWNPRGTRSIARLLTGWSRRWAGCRTTRRTPMTFLPAAWCLSG